MRMSGACHGIWRFEMNATDCVPMYSCNRCRQQKIKCSGLRPCEQCRKRSLACSFDDKDRKILVSKESGLDLGTLYHSIITNTTDSSMTCNGE